MRKILVLLHFSVFVYCASGQVFHKSYYSFPDRSIEVIIYDTCLYWHNCITQKGDIEGYYHYKIVQDTIFIEQKGAYSPPKIAIINGEYLDFIVGATKQNCGMIFMIDNRKFKMKYKYIIKHSAVRGTQRLTFELYRRIERLGVFQKSCDCVLPDIGEIL